MSTETLQVCDPQGNPRVLGPLLARGGEGNIHPLRDRSEVLVKWYHASELDKRGAQRRRKIEAMVAMGEFRDARQLAWPLLSLTDSTGNWIGYAMYRVEGVKLFLLAHAMLYRKHFPGLNRLRLVEYLIDLVTQVQALHACGIMIGDYNLHNILCDPNSNRIALIDCDSYQIRHRGQHYPCPVGSADMTPIEQQNRDFTTLERTAASEAFSLAIVLFKCLMLGRHPYDIVGGEDPVSNLCNGRFAYGTGNRGIPRGAWYNIWSHMPYHMKNLFVTTFTEGAEQPERRATPAQWREALERYHREMLKGWHETAIVPAQPKAAIYRGTITERAQATRELDNRPDRIF